MKDVAVSAFFVDEKGSSGLDRAHLLANRERLGNGSGEKKSGRARGIDRARDLASREERLHLRREADRSAVIGEVERLDSVRIARDEQSSRTRVPNHKREHPAQ